MRPEPKRPAVHPDLLDEWGKNIARGRDLLGLDQRTLAEGLGVAPATVCRWELGDNAPTDADKVRIAVLLHQEVRTLFPLSRATALVNVPEAT